MESHFILGTVQFGSHYGINNRDGVPTKEQIFDILDLAYENGIVQLDTADAYGNAHEIIGAYLKEKKGVFQINTKFRVDSRISIKDQLLTAFKQLQIEKVHVYFYHRFQELIQFPENLEILDQLKKQGFINMAGVSIYTNEEFEICCDMPGLDVIQVPYNLFDNFSKKGNLLEGAKKNGKVIQARSVFLQGLFFNEHDTLPVTLSPLSKYIVKLNKLTRKYNITMYDLALSYVMINKEIDYIIIGVDNKEQLHRNLEVQSRILSEELINEINDIKVKEESLLYPYNWE